MKGAGIGIAKRFFVHCIACSPWRVALVLPFAFLNLRWDIRALPRQTGVYVPRRLSHVVEPTPDTSGQRGCVVDAVHRCVRWTGPGLERSREGGRVRQAGDPLGGSPPGSRIPTFRNGRAARRRRDLKSGPASVPGARQTQKRLSVIAHHVDKYIARARLKPRLENTTLVYRILGRSSIGP